MVSQKCKQSLKVSGQILLCVIFFPILLLVAIFWGLYLLMSSILQGFVSAHATKKYEKKRIKNMLTPSEITQVNQKSVQEEAVFTVKPFSSINLYLSLNDGYLNLITQDQTYINSLKVKHTFKAGDYQNFCSYLYYINFPKSLKYIIYETKLQIPSAYINNVVFNQNRVYFCVLDMIFELKCNLEIHLVAQLPQFYRYNSVQTNTNSSGQMFVLDNIVYVHNNCSKLFKLNGNRLECVDDQHFNNCYYQFYNKVFAVNNAGIHKVNRNFSFVRLQAVAKVKIIFASGGTIVMKNNQVRCDVGQPQFWVLNMLDETVISIQQLEQQFDAENFSDNVVLGVNGFQLKPKILRKLFGPDFELRLVSYHNENYRGFTQQHASSFKNLLFSSNLNIIIQKKYSDSLKRLERVRNFLTAQKSKVQHILQLPANQLQQLVATFSNYVNIETAQ
ncbi:Hypothetical_protein [Hexamita inflata]|uniref:Hypothetical_protein n=1 Tax=Hexamita inflata TaxID=28002 RepID=A0AA86UMM3_9EUKA|nr:Hypothetical protein HINF_LOCUS48959 [Hexamita inflata]CAI9961317.1 Hypothetical protein HINF_LOCUS48962 [Hexamita inflata]